MGMNTHAIQSNKASTILDVSTATTGESFKKPAEKVTFQLVITGGMSTELQGSNDDTNWVSLATNTVSSGYVLTDPWVYVRAVTTGTGTSQVIMGR